MGNVIASIAPNSSLSQIFPPQSKFDPRRDIPDLTGKVALVTGGNSGVGYHIVKQLLLKNAKVYLAARSPTKYQEAAKRLKEETGGKEPILLQLDLADLLSVKTAAKEFLNKEERLDILFNNAGVMVPPVDQLTAQGYDLQFGTDVLGHYFFTIQLLPALKSSTAYHKSKARVMSTSSSAHTMAPGKTGLDWKTMKGGPERDKAVKNLGSMADWKLYGATKTGSIFLSHIYTKYHGDVVTAFTVHPGGLVTDVQRHLSSSQRWIAHKLCYPASFGALTALWGGTTAKAEAVSDKYLIPWARIGKPDPRGEDETTCEELKQWLDEQLKGR